MLFNSGRQGWNILHHVTLRKREREEFENRVQRERMIFESVF
jgi:hypothetical protein